MERIALFVGFASALAGCATTAKVDPNALALAGAVSNQYVRAGELDELAARLHLTARSRSAEERPAVNLVVVIDTSGSMEGAPIRDAQKAALALVDALSGEDQLALVSFDSETKVLVPMTRVDAVEAKKIREAIAGMKAEGTTDMAGGLRASLAELYRVMDAQRVSRIVLLSDGIPNDPSMIAAFAQEAKNSRITVTALGLGLEYDETLLAQLARTTGGRFHFIENSAEVAKVFQTEVLRLERVVARNATVLLRPGPGVVIKGVPGHALNASGNGQFYIPLGDFTEGDQRELLVDLDVQGRKDGASVELMDAVLEFDELEGTGHVVKRLYLAAHATGDRAKIDGARDKDVALSALKAGIAAATVDAVGLARAGRMEEAKALLTRTEARARAMAKELGAEELGKEADSLNSILEALPTYATPPPAQPAAQVNPSGRDLEYDNRNVKKAHDRAMQSIQESTYKSSPLVW